MDEADEAVAVAATSSFLHVFGVIIYFTFSPIHFARPLPTMMETNPESIFVTQTNEVFVRPSLIGFWHRMSLEGFESLRQIPREYRTFPLPEGNICRKFPDRGNATSFGRTSTCVVDGQVQIETPRQSDGRNRQHQKERHVVGISCRNPTVTNRRTTSAQSN